MYGIFLNWINLFVCQIKFRPQCSKLRRSLSHLTCYCRSSKPFCTTPTLHAVSIRSRLNTDTHAQHVGCLLHSIGIETHSYSSCALSSGSLSALTGLHRPSHSQALVRVRALSLFLSALLRNTFRLPSAFSARAAKRNSVTASSQSAIGCRSERTYTALRFTLAKVAITHGIIRKRKKNI